MGSGIESPGFGCYEPGVQPACTKAKGSCSRGKTAASRGGSLSRPVNTQTPVEITVICPAFRRLMAIADAHGKFSFSFDVHRESDSELAAAGCVLCANLPGYRSAAKAIADLIHSSRTSFGKIVLQPITADVSGYVSSDRNVNVGQKRSLARALNRVSRQDYPAAIRILSEVVSTNPDYSSLG